MTATEYVKIFEGNFILGQRITTNLFEIGINPIVKDETESQRLAGYSSYSYGIQEIHVHKDEYFDAVNVVRDITMEINN